MDTLSILHQHPSTVLGIKLTSTQQALLCFLVPAIANCIIYIIDFASNVAVVERHFEESNVRWGILTLIILYIHSFVYFALTVSNVEKWNEQIEQSRVVKWFLIRLLQLVAFPVLGLYRYSKIIFWSIEALYQNDIMREQALQNASQPSYIEMYLFLQAFLQGLPQAAFQLFILYSEHSDNRETDSTQVLCIASSLMIVASTTASFQRFESQKNLGRVKPWDKLVKPTVIPQPPNLKLNNEANTTNREPQDLNISSDIESNEKQLGVNNDSNNPTQFLQTCEILQNQYNLHNCQKHEAEENANESNWDSGSGDSTPYLQPRVIIKAHDSLSENISVTSIEPNYIFLNTEEKKLTHPPCNAAIKLDNKIDMPVQNTDALRPDNNSLSTFQPTSRMLELPTRRIPTKGLEQDDIIGKTVSFLVWFLFLISRILALVSSLYFFPWIGLGFIVFQYSITLFIINKCFKILPPITTPTILIKMYLAFVFCFCLIEFKIKFRKIYVLYTIYFTIIIMENIVLNTLWYLLGEWDGWWYNYTYFLFLGCQTLCIICLFMYCHAFKPKSHVFYTD